MNKQVRNVVFLLVFGLNTSAVAAVTEVGQGAFGPSTVLINFDDYPEWPPEFPEITGFTATTESDGVTFIDPSSVWDTGNNSEPFRQTYTIGGPVELTFDARLHRVGFIFGGNQDFDVPFETRRNGVTTGSFNLLSTPGPASETNWYFVGFEDLEGIDSIWFGKQQPDPWIYGIFDLTFDLEPVPSPVEPIPVLNWPALLFLILAMFGAGTMRFRRTR